MSPQLLKELSDAIRDVPDFPQPGILFKDITPLFLDSALCDQLAFEMLEQFRDTPIDAICAIESRGFFLGMLLANKLNVPLFPVRKKGKLPAKTRSYAYQLEYGEATLEIHTEVVKPGWKVLIHDDILATGGTAVAAAELVGAEGGEVVGFSFIAELSFLGGREKLLAYQTKIESGIIY